MILNHDELNSTFLHFCFTVYMPSLADHQRGSDPRVRSESRSDPMFGGATHRVHANPGASVSLCPLGGGVPGVGGSEKYLRTSQSRWRDGESTG